MKDSTIKTKKKYLENVYFIIGVVLILLIWLISSYTVDNNIVIPKISNVIKRLINLIADSYTIKIILLTMGKLFLVTFLCAVLGYILAVLAYLFNPFYLIIRPLITVVRTMPIVTIIILLLLYVGFDLTPILICAFVILPIIYEEVLVGFKNIDKNIIEETKMLSNINFMVIKDVYFPLSIPYFVSSIFTVLGLGLKVLVMAEVFSLGENTIGEQIQVARSLADTTSIFAWTIIILLIVFVFELILKMITKKRLFK